MDTSVQGGPGAVGAVELFQSPKINLDKLVIARNICDLLDDDCLGLIANLCVSAYRNDLSSRTDWETKTANIMKLAMQVVEKKTYPWPDASNVKFPLLTVAALQYHARAYSTLCVPGDIVKYQVFGPDADGKKVSLGKMISEHMNYQLVEQSTDWEDSFDKTLLIKSLAGCAFKKTYFDQVSQMWQSDIVYPVDLVINYYAKTIDSAPTVTHTMERPTNYVKERQALKLYRDCDLRPSGSPIPRGPLRDSRDKRTGQHAPPAPSNQHFICEQCCWLDLDGDGYAEPYVVIFDLDSQQVLRIYARFKRSGIQYTEGAGKRVVSITPVRMYTKYGFIPAPDGSIYDIGLGQLLYSSTESINTMLNQLIDAGTLANTAGGFLGRGVKIKAGQNLFQPFGWKPVDSTGDDLRKNIFPLPVREPSQVLLKCIELLLNYGERVAGAPDVSVGQLPGQNTPAETSRMANTNSERVLSAILKRDYRALKDEFRIIYELNATYLDRMPANPFGITREHYALDPVGIRPAAEPSMLGEAQARQQAELLAAASMSAPGYNLYQVQKRRLEAWRIPNIEQILPDPKGPNALPPPPNPKLMDSETKQFLAKGKLLDMQAKAKTMLSKAMVEVSKADAQIALLEAQAAKARADAGGVSTGHAIALMDLQLGQARDMREHHLNTSAEMRNILEMLSQPMEQTTDGNKSNPGPGGLGSVETPSGDAGGNGAPAPAA